MMKINGVRRIFDSNKMDCEETYFSNRKGELHLYSVFCTYSIKVIYDDNNCLHNIRVEVDSVRRINTALMRKGGTVREAFERVLGGFNIDEEMTYKSLVYDGKQKIGISKLKTANNTFDEYVLAVNGLEVPSHRLMSTLIIKFNKINERRNKFTKEELLQLTCAPGDFDSRYNFTGNAG